MRDKHGNIENTLFKNTETKTTKEWGGMDLQNQYKIKTNSPSQKFRQVIQ